MLTPIEATPTTCATIDTTPGALMEPPVPPGQPAVPIPWSELVIKGQFLDGDTKDSVRALFEPTLAKLRTSLSQARFPDIAAVTARFGYQLVGHVVEGDRLVLDVSPLPIVRKVDVAVVQSSWLPWRWAKLFDDDVLRRMRARAGAYLPWEPVRLQCALIEERGRIEDFLRDEGYFDATVEIYHELDRATVKVKVKVSFGDAYTIGRVKIAKPPGIELDIADSDIKATFVHNSWFSDSRFTRTQHQEDVRKVKELFQKAGFPAVRVQSDFDPKTSFDRRTHRVNVTIAIDPRRRVDYLFEGSDRDAFGDDDLRSHLTFNAAGSADELEAVASARAIQTYMQTRGFFDAHVTESRESLGTFDRITFHLEQGKTREIRSVQFVGNHAIDTVTLEDIVATKEVSVKSSLLGTTTAATSEQLATDLDRIREAYRRIGYRDAAITVSASPVELGLGDAALIAGLVAADQGDALYVRYTVDEGAPTLLTTIEVVDPGKASDRAFDPKLCELALKELATEIGDPQLASRATPDPKVCVAVAANLKFREDDVAATKDRLRDYLFKTGRPRATVEYSVESAAHRVKAIYKITKTDELKIGRIVIRGNFRTRRGIISDLLDLHEGELLTTDALAEAARRVRNTGLFAAVNIDMPDLENPGEVVNAIVRVEERYDYLAQVDLEGGYSSFNGVFGTVRPRFPNLGGTGISLVLTGTDGQKIRDAEATFRIPAWLVWNLANTDITGLYTVLDTARFGLLTTEGASLAFNHIYRRDRTATRDARTITWTIARYDFRLRTRNVDALRPIGADTDDTQVAISTRTGSVGASLVYDGRVDRRGQLAPLAPEAGLRGELSATFASTHLLGDDTFVKLSAAGSKFVPVGKNLVLRADLRTDWGIPLGGAVLLPEVERFFAGGDNTVRGYNDDRLATEIVQVGVPPIANLSQIRVQPAGGNIRVLSSLDAQVRIYKILAGALFTDAGMITNQWQTVTTDDIRPSVGMGLRALSPFGIGALEYAVPLRPHLGDDPRGRIHLYFAARAQV